MAKKIKEPEAYTIERRGKMSPAMYTVRINYIDQTVGCWFTRDNAKLVKHALENYSVLVGGQFLEKEFIEYLKTLNHSTETGMNYQDYRNILRTKPEALQPRDEIVDKVRAILKDLTELESLL